MLEALGNELAKVRKTRRDSLESVAREAQISPAYLQKLERGLVKSPSPRVLARVSEALHVPYLRLMELAGYLDEAQVAEAGARAPSPHPLTNQGLSSEEWRAVGAFITTLVAQRGA